MKFDIQFSGLIHIGGAMTARGVCEGVLASEDARRQKPRLICLKTFLKVAVFSVEVTGSDPKPN